MSSTKFEGCCKCHNANIYIYKHNLKENFTQKFQWFMENKYIRKQVHRKQVH